MAMDDQNIVIGTDDAMARLYKQTGKKAVVTYKGVKESQFIVMKLQVVIAVIQFLSFPFSGQMPWHSAAEPAQKATMAITLDLPEVFNTSDLKMGPLIIAAAAAPLFLELFWYTFGNYQRALPYNAHYVLHRCTEIFMVLLGESVLQLITSVHPTHHVGDEDSQAELQFKFSMAQVMGFLLSLTAMHSFTIQEPDKDHHVMSKGGSAKAALWMLLFMLKSISVWMIGIGIKLALYDIEADADAFFAHDQKILLGFSCAACFLLTELMAPMHTAISTRATTPRMINSLLFLSF